jgi:hypothetical protein
MIIQIEIDGFHFHLETLTAAGQAVIERPFFATEQPWKPGMGSNKFNILNYAVRSSTLPPFCLDSLHILRIHSLARVLSKVLYLP